VEKQSAHSDGVSSVAFSPDGTTIVSGSYDKTIKVWDAGVGTDTPEPSAQT
jgi:WD40 repeat protein